MVVAKLGILQLESRGGVGQSGDVPEDSMKGFAPDLGCGVPTRSAPTDHIPYLIENSKIESSSPLVHASSIF
jgi:hypothetical protein